MIPFIVGAYAAVSGIDDADARALLEVVLASPGVNGLEVSFGGSLMDSAALLRADQCLVVTLVRNTVVRIKDDPKFGLASVDSQARGRAVAAALECVREVQEINDRAGRGITAAVEFQSAPSATSGSSVGDLARSLDEIASWDWDGARLLLEHCDAGNRPGRVEKGFLSLDEEIAAIDDANVPFGIAINWGRSAIEGTSVLTPTIHARQAGDRGLLNGLMFSGVSDSDDARGGAWADAHLPPSEIDARSGSLMDATAVRRTLGAIQYPDDLAFVGVKVSCPREEKLAQRIPTILGSIGHIAGQLEKVAAALH